MNDHPTLVVDQRINAEFEETLLHENGVPSRVRSLSLTKLTVLDENNSKKFKFVMVINP